MFTTILHLLSLSATAQDLTPTWTALPVCMNNISICETIYTATPKPTRNPALLRFTDPTLTDPKWVPLHVERLADPVTDEAVQMALITLLQQTRADLSPYMTTVHPLFTDSSAELRAGMAELLPAFQTEFQTELIAMLMKDDDWLVRSQTLRVVARHLGTIQSVFLIDGLTDPHADVRLHAVKGLGWNEIVLPLSTVAPLLNDPESAVRLHALRTIERTHPGAAVKSGLVDTMLNDPDPKVQREILRIKTAH